MNNLEEMNSDTKKSLLLRLKNRLLTSATDAEWKSD